MEAAEDVAEVVSGLVVDRFLGVASGGKLLRKSASVGPLCCAAATPTKSRFLSGEMEDGQMPSRLPGISYLMEAEFHFAAGENSAVGREEEIK